MYIESLLYVCGACMRCIYNAYVRLGRTTSSTCAARWRANLRCISRELASDVWIELA
jgi:hypothetical protein